MSTPRQPTRWASTSTRCATPVCFWQYDVVGQDNPNDIVGGPNGKLSLNQARDNYKKFGACSEDMVPYVRKPNKEEIDIENSDIN